MSTRRVPWSGPRRVLGILILLFTGFLTFQVTARMDAHQEKEEALAELQHVRHGLLDAGVWAEKIATVIGAKVDQLANDPQSRENLRPRIEAVIQQVIQNTREMVEGQIEADHKYTGELQKWVLGKALRWEKLEKKAPEFAERILQGLDDPEQMGALQSTLKSKLREFVETTWSAGDKAALSAALTQLGCAGDTSAGHSACAARTVRELEELRGEADQASALILALFFAFLAVAWRTRESLGRLDFHLLVGATFVLLAGGLANPMMRIEAKLLEVNLTLLGESLTFTNQVLFHQSKSILDVVSALWGAGLQYSAVAALIALFSVGFPSLKLLSSTLLLEVAALRENRLVRFFALHSGKWSMADVFVIAIFMAYIGFSGILEGQLSQADPGVVTPATEGTSFLPGLHLFTGFCLASLFVGSLLEGHLKRA